MKRSKIWLIFLITIAAVLVLNSCIISFTAFIFIRLGLASSGEPISWLPLFGAGVSAILIAVGLTLVISRYFFAPIQSLVNALSQVAAGDFTVQLPETSAWPEIRNMNINFNKMVQELNSAETLQTDFVQTVSHEFKTPLAAIEGYASLLSEASLAPEEQDYVMRIQKSSRRLSEMTHNILSLSRLENQSIISKREFFSIDEQLRQTILLLEPLWTAKELQMDLNLPSVFYHGNEDLISGIWFNLLSNAIKFTPKGGCIGVCMATGKTTLSVSVSDTGIGMTLAVKERIFDRFYQADNSRSIEGSGLGLTLVKKILDLCSGTITVTSTPGAGSVFTVELPLSDPGHKKSPMTNP